MISFLRDKVKNMFRFFFLFTFVFSITNANAVIVLKTKNKKALVLLEGLKTQKGAYFDIFDLEGDKKGLAQMDRVAQTKAIVSLKAGSIAKNWILEPVSKELALYELKKEQKRKALSARIHSQQIKRKVAFKKKQLDKARKRRLALKRQLEREKRRKIAKIRLLNRKKHLARKKQQIQRKIASFSLEENVLEGLEDLGDMEQSSEVLSYEAPTENQAISGKKQQPTEDLSYQMPSEAMQADQKEQVFFEPEPRDNSSIFKLGILPRMEFDFMKVSPISSSSYVMSGIGFGAFFSTNFSLNSFLDLGSNIGAKRFAVSAGEEECGQVDGCSLLIYYASASLNLKLNLIQFFGHKIWLKGEGTLLQPLMYSNKVPYLTKESFSPFHGSLGGGLGLELNFGNLSLPISLDANLYMPPTQTTFTGNAGLQFGLYYKF